MAVETLQQALEREHHEIDAGIAAYSAAAASMPATTDSLTSAMGALRRHIYLEEQFLFPPLRAAGMMAPVFVMIREHGQMWRTLDTLQAQLAPGEVGSDLRTESVSGAGAAAGADDGEASSATPADGAAAGVLSTIEQLVAELAAHNSKEEQILYPQADAVLNGAASEELRAFLAAGETPAGWVCQGART